MSTVMYCFRSKNRDDLNHQIQIMNELIKKHHLNPSQEGGIKIQVFDTSFGILFRVLEHGYGLRNLLWSDESQFKTCNYDNRSDITEEEEGNEMIADEIDHLILDGKYEVISLTISS